MFPDMESLFKKFCDSNENIPLPPLGTILGAPVVFLPFELLSKRNKFFT